MVLPSVDLASLSIAVAVIIALVNGFQLAVDFFASPETAKKIKGFISFVLGVALGLLFGAIHWFGLVSPEVGLVAGLVSSGLFKLTQNVGGK